MVDLVDAAHAHWMQKRIAELESENSYLRESVAAWESKPDRDKAWRKDAIAQMTARDKRIAELEAELAEAKDAIRGMFAACDEWAAEFTLKKRGMNWGLVNDAYVKANRVLGPTGPKEE